MSRKPQTVFDVIIDIICMVAKMAVMFFWLLLKGLEVFLIQFNRWVKEIFS